MKRVLLAACAALSLAAVACDNAPSDEECEKLLLRTIEIEQAAAGTAQAANAEAKRNELAGLARDEFVELCKKDLPRRRVRCALGAKTKAELLACDEQ